MITTQLYASNRWRCPECDTWLCIVDTYNTHRFLGSNDASRPTMLSSGAVNACQNQRKLASHSLSAVLRSTTAIEVLADANLNVLIS
jgi:hypothetical protein